MKRIDRKGQGFATWVHTDCCPRLREWWANGVSLPGMLAINIQRKKSVIREGKEEREERREKKWKTCSLFSFICVNVLMPKWKCQRKELWYLECSLCLCRDYASSCCSSLQKVGRCCIYEFKIEETKHSSQFLVGQNDSGTAYNFLFHIMTTSQVVSL